MYIQEPRTVTDVDLTLTPTRVKPVNGAHDPWPFAHAINKRSTSVGALDFVRPSCAIVMRG